MSSSRSILAGSQVEIGERLRKPVEHVEPLDEVKVAGDHHVAVAGLRDRVLDAARSRTGRAGRAADRSRAWTSPPADGRRLGPCSSGSRLAAQPQPQSSSAAWSKNQPRLARSISQQSQTSLGTSARTFCQNGNRGGVANSIARRTISRRSMACRTDPSASIGMGSLSRESLCCPAFSLAPSSPFCSRSPSARLCRQVWAFPLWRRLSGPSGPRGHPSMGHRSSRSSARIEHAEWMGEERFHYCVKLILVVAG